MRALLVTLEGIKEVEIGTEVEKMNKLLSCEPVKPSDMDNLQSMYRLLECQTVCGAGYPDTRHACWADDDGLIHLRDGTQGNIVAWYPEPLIGKLLITGFDPETGETTPATMSVHELASMVKVGIFRDRSKEDGT